MKLNAGHHTPECLTALSTRQQDKKQQHKRNHLLPHDLNVMSERLQVMLVRVWLCIASSYSMYWLIANILAEILGVVTVRIRCAALNTATNYQHCQYLGKSIII